MGSRLAALAASPEGRRRFADSVADFVVRYGFDGLDLDWEFPTIADRENVSLLVGELRRALGGRWLSLSAGATAARLAALDLPALASDLDCLNLMAYDYHGAWDGLTGHQSALYPDPLDPAVRAAWTGGRYNVHDAVQYCLRNGFPPEKLLIGCPVYGRAWYVEAIGSPVDGTVSQTDAELNGRFRPASREKPVGTWRTGTYDFDDLANDALWPPANRHHDPESRASWYYDPASGFFASWDDELSIRAKAEFVRSMGLGGMAFWQLAADREGRLPRLAASVLGIAPAGYSGGANGGIMESAGDSDDPERF